MTATTTLKMTAELTAEDIACLHGAVSYLATLDTDHARDENGIGYSQADTHVGHEMAATPPDAWGPELVEFARHLVRKYRGQLQGSCEDLEATGPIAFTPSHARQLAEKAQAACGRSVNVEGSGRTITLEAGEIVVRFPYNADLVAECRKIQGRRWDAVGKVNRFPTWARDAITEWAERRGFEVAPEVDALTAEERPAPAFTGIDFVAEKQLVKITFDYDREKVSLVKQMVSGVKWDKGSVAWWAPAASAPDARKYACRVALPMSEAFVAWAERAVQEAEEAVAASKATDAEVEVPGLAEGASLLPYQRAGVAYALDKRRCLIADEMGLGKTVQGLASVIAGGAVPAIVVCPNSAKLHWAREVAKFFPGYSTTIVRGTAARLSEPSRLDLRRRSLAGPS
jgi:hypothetical protein